MHQSQARAQVNLETKLTAIRIVLAPFILGLILAGQYVAALILYPIAAIPDIFDGYIARKNKRNTDNREVLDALADFGLVFSTVFSLAIAREGTWLLALGIVSVIGLSIIIGYISIMRGRLTIPHLNSARIFGCFVHPTVMAYIADWRYAEYLLFACILTGSVAAIHYIIYARRIFGLRENLA